MTTQATVPPKVVVPSIVPPKVVVPVQPPVPPKVTIPPKPVVQVVGLSKPTKFVDITSYIEKDPWSGVHAVFNMLVYSEPGEGKTPFLATVIDVPRMVPALLIDCDSGTLSVRESKGLNTIHLLARSTEKGILAWDILEEIYAWLVLADHPYKTVMLDGGTELQRFCELSCISLAIKKRAEDGKDHDLELAELGDYRRLQERMRRTYTKFRDIVTKDGRRVNFIATAHEGKLKDDLTGAITIQPLFTGKLAPMAASVFDIVARLKTTEDGKKFLVPHLEGRARGRDRSRSLGNTIENPTMAKIAEKIFAKA